MIDLAESLSFWHIKEEVCERFLELFKDGYLSASAIYTYENELHITQKVIKSYLKHLQIEL